MVEALAPDDALGSIEELENGIEIQVLPGAVVDDGRAAARGLGQGPGVGSDQRQVARCAPRPAPLCAQLRANGAEFSLASRMSDDRHERNGAEGESGIEGDHRGSQWPEPVKKSA